MWKSKDTLQVLHLVQDSFWDVKDTTHKPHRKIEQYGRKLSVIIYENLQQV